MKKTNFEEEKIHLYTTAYSPLLEEYVKIENARKDANGVYLLDCTLMDGTPFLFRIYELIRYTI